MLKSIWQDKIYLPILLVVVLIVFAMNYSYGTTLSGWDNLQTELNPTLNISRGFWGVWQDFQSFGNTSGMAYPATFVYSVMTYLLSMLLPVSLIRYFLVFCFIFIGDIGVYYLLKFLGFDEEKRPLSLIGALVYIFSLPNLQLIALPTESFISFMALLPFEVLLSLRIFHATTKKDTFKYSLLLFLVMFFGAIQFLTQTMFVVLVFVIFSFGFELFFHLSFKRALGRNITIFYILLASSLFWILPQIYFLANNYSIVGSSKINQIATENVILQNLSRGNVWDFMVGKGIYFDLFSANGDRIFSNWEKHFSHPITKVATVVLVSCFFLGIFKKSKYHLGFVLLYFDVALVLLNVFPLNFIGQLLREVPLVSQIFRSPFTKFASVYALLFAYFIVSGLDSISTFIFNRTKYNSVSLRANFLSFISITFLFVFAFPIFQGELFPKFLKVNFPSSYTEIQTFFSAIPKTERIVIAPDASFWGWYKHSWGYEGSGFLWYGLDHPIIARTFDVWGQASESFYWEEKYAFESKNPALLANVLDKYSIDWLLFDNSLLPITPGTGGIKYPIYKEVLNATPGITQVKAIGDLEIYKFDKKEVTSSYISVSDSLPPVIGPEVSLTDLDTAYVQVGDYLSGLNPQVIYPFLDLTTKTRISNKGWKIYEGPNYTTLIFESTDDLESKYNLILPEVPLTSGKIFNGTSVEVLKPSFEATLKGNKLELTIEKRLINDFKISAANVKNCGLSTGTISSEVKGTDLVLKSGGGGIACFGFDLPFLPHWNGYFVSTLSKNVENNALYLYILGGKSDRFSRFEDKLSHGVSSIILPEGFYFDDGYSFVFQNQAFGNITSENILESLAVYIFPFNYIKNITLVSKDYQMVQDPAINVEVSSNAIATKILPILYKVEGLGQEVKVVKFWQSYDRGWIAVCGLKLCNVDHVRVNNWANAWVSGTGFDSQTVYIFFWPAILQHLGWIFGVIYATHLFKLYRKDNIS
ncbi:hypothetical protein HYV31_00220 [candidate division WWE3 bacterium]|nr:hypothetical protein [candidate division WWE3 bacterium]